MNKSKMQSLLDEIIHRKATIKELEKATKILEAQLETEMGKKGLEKVEGATGGVAFFMPNTTVKGGKMATLLRTFDARTMAALLSGSTINKSKQGFLERAFPDKNLGKVLETMRTSSFRVEQPRTQEQRRMVAEAIEADVREQEATIGKTLAEWRKLEGVKAPPDNPLVDEALKGPAKKKTTKKKAAKKRGKK